MSWTEEETIGLARTDIIALKTVKSSEIYKVMTEYKCDYLEAKRILAEKRGELKMNPQKPVYIDGDCDMPLCPQCRLPVDEEEEGNRCSVCGQEIDWSDDNA